jgi:hypothetical protein
MPYYTDEQVAAARQVVDHLRQEKSLREEQDRRLSAIEQAPANAEFNARYEGARQRAKLSEAAMVDVTNRAMADGVFSPEIAVKNYSSSSWNLFENMVPPGPAREAALKGDLNSVADILRRNIGGG